MRINRIFRPRTGFLRLVFLLLAVLSGSCTLEPPPKNVPPTIASLSGGGIEVKARSSDGYITSLAYTDAGLFFLEEQPDSMDSPVFGIEVFDELARTSYNDLRDSSFVSAFHQEPEEVTFTRQFKNAPFSLIQRISRDRGGIYLNCRLVLEEEAPGRSVRFTYLVPVPLGYMFTMPGVDEPVLLDGERAVRFRYGGGKFGTGSVAIPLAVLWKPGAGVGLSIAVPLEINTARVTFNIEPAIHSRPPAGSYPRREEFNYLRITFDLMGIRADRDLETGLWLYSHEDDWRPSLKIFSEKYQSYFACRAPATEEPAGRLVPVDPGGAEPAAVRLMQRMDVGLAKIGWNFQRYGQWIPPQAIRFSDFTWACQADPRKYPEISVREVRSLAEALSTAGIQPVLGAAFSLRCDRSLAEDIFFADIARDELGAPIESGDGAVLMHSSPTSPFGRHILEQQRLMIDTYPEAAGFYFEDLSRAAVDFAHDDNLTMVHNRPACNLGNIFRTLGPKLARMVHDAGKLVLARPATTISASRGIDIFCFEGEDLDRNIGALALMCLDRPVVSLPARDETPDPVELELEMQRQILWGVLPSTSLMQASPELARAYRLLHQSLKGRKWILEPHALGQFPKGVRGNLFRVPSSDRPDRTDLLVTVVRPGVRLADQSSGRGVSVRVRLPGAERLTRALWTAAARPAWPVPLNAVYDNEAGELKVELPPFGPAGVLRLARR